MNYFNRIARQIRQYSYPEPIRISDTDFDSLISVEQIKQLLENIQTAVENQLNVPPPETHPPANGPSQENILDDKFIADLVTRLWRIKSGLISPDTREPYKKTSRSFRYLDRLMDTLTRQGIKIIDKTGDFYDSGMMMEVIAAEPVEGIEREIIKETLEPMILKEDRIIQTAKVIIGTQISDDTNVKGE